MKKSSILAIFIFISVTVFPQVGITAFTSSVLAVSSSREKAISLEGKAFINREISKTGIEGGVMYNFPPSEYHRFSAGVAAHFLPFGIKINNFFYGFTLPAQLEVFPLQNFKQLSLVYEFALSIEVIDGMNFRHLLGVRYTINNK